MKPYKNSSLKEFHIRKIENAKIIKKYSLYKFIYEIDKTNEPAVITTAGSTKNSGCIILFSGCYYNITILDSSMIALQHY